MMSISCQQFRFSVGPFWLFLASILFSGCDLFSSAIDGRAPRVSIVQPAADPVVSGEHVLVIVEASALGEDNWISFVNVTIDTEKVGEATQNGDVYVFRLDTKNLDDGSHRLEAVAYDRFQARGISEPHEIIVQNLSPEPGPKMDILAPLEKDELSGVVRVVARTQPGQPGVGLVELLVDGFAVLSATSSTGNDTYIFDLDTTPLLPGEHFLQVRAYSESNGFDISDAILVDVLSLGDSDTPSRPGSVVWRTVGYNGEVRGAVAVGFNNDLYVGSSSDTLYAFSPSGQLKWKYSTLGPIRSAPLVGNNEDVFVTSEDGRLYGLDSDGHPLWSAYNTAAALRSAPTLGVEGALYFGDAEGRLHAVSSFNGQPLAGSWPLTISAAPIIAPPVIARDRTIFVASGDGHVYAASPEGAVLWQSVKNIGNVTVGMALIELVVPSDTAGENDAIENILYAVSSDGMIYSLSGTSGEERWNYALPGPMRSAPIVGPDGTVYVGTSTGLVALNEEKDDLTPRLRFVFPADDVGTPAIDSNEVVYFVSRNHVHAINPNNTPIWSFNLGAESDAPLTISRNGDLIVAGQNGMLTALETGSIGLALSKWPMFQRNARHTGRLGLDAND